MTRNPKPTALLELEKGKLYSDQRDRAALEPKPHRELKPRCPRRFTREERKSWRGIAEVLKNYRLFTAANAIQMELLAVSWTQYVEACSFLATKAKGMLFVPESYDSAGKGKGFKENPILGTQRRLRTEISAYSQNLGLSSIALAKIGGLMLKKQKEKNGFFED